MAEAEQQIDVGRPRPNAVDRGQGAVCVVGRHVNEGGKIEFIARDRTGNGLEGTNFRR